MVRLIASRKMMVGTLLLRPGVPSEPMLREDAEAMIAARPEKLARLWLGTILRIVEDDGTWEAPPVREDRVEAVVSAALAVEAMLVALTDEEREQVMEHLEAARRSRHEAEEPDSSQAAESDSDEDIDGDEGADAASGDTDGPSGDEGAPPDGAPPTTPPASLDGLTIPQATPIIEAATDIELLQGWRESDSRKGVHELIDERLEALTAPPPPPPEG